jgi:secondary thiamine-phosphate synthase enzyme
MNFMLKTENWLLSPHNSIGFEKYSLVDHLESNSLIYHTEYLFFNVPKRYALINISELVEASVARSNIRDGLCFVSTMHITAGVYINDAESGLLRDIAQWIEELAPFGHNYHHHQTGEDNGDAHLKSYLTNSSITLPITKGKIDFGTWQQLFYAEFDGMRTKRILIKSSGIRL